MDFCVWKFYVSLSTFALCAVWLWVCLCVYIIYERERERERKMGHLSLIYIIFANVISHLNYLSLFYSEWEYLSNYIYYSTNTHNKFNMYICICLKWTNFEGRFLCTCGTSGLMQIVFLLLWPIHTWISNPKIFSRLRSPALIIPTLCSIEASFFSVSLPS